MFRMQEKRRDEQIVALLDQAPACRLDTAASCIDPNPAKGREAILQLVAQGKLFLQGDPTSPDCIVETPAHRRLRRLAEMHAFWKRIHANR